MVQGCPGRPPLATKREQFTRLIARGVGSAEACRIVGVHPKTGKRWRLGRVMTSSSGARLHYAAVVSTGKQVISERYLSEAERVRIADLRRSGSGVRVIAAQLGRSPSTVSRELRRNQDPRSGRSGRQPRSGGRRGGGPGPGGASCYATRCCASSSPAGWRSDGARNRSAMLCAAGSPAIGGGIWRTRPSTRRSTGRSCSGCARTCRGCCALAGITASRAAALMPAGQGC